MCIIATDWLFEFQIHNDEHSAWVVLRVKPNWIVEWANEEKKLFN